MLHWVDALSNGHTSSVSCMHGTEKKYVTQWLLIKFDNQQQQHVLTIAQDNSAHRAPPPTAITTTAAAAATPASRFCYKNPFYLTYFGDKKKYPPAIWRYTQIERTRNCSMWFYSSSLGFFSLLYLYVHWLSALSSSIVLIPKM